MKKSPLKRTPFKRKPYKNNTELDQALCERAGGEWIAGKCIGAKCETCDDKNRDFRGLSRSLIISKGRGGKDGLHNEIIECYPDHDKYEKCPETRPKNSLGYKLYLEQIK